MGNEFEYELDLTDQNYETCDLGKAVPEGWYHAVLATIKDDTKAGGTPRLEFTYQILAGSPDGHRAKSVVDHLYFKDTTRDRQILYAKRLGLLKKDDFGKTAKFSWDQAVGRKVVIHVMEEEYDKGDGKKGKTSKLFYDGVYPEDHPEVRDVPREGQPPRTGAAPGGKQSSPASQSNGKMSAPAAAKPSAPSTAAALANL